MSSHHLPTENPMHLMREKSKQNPEDVLDADLSGVLEFEEMPHCCTGIHLKGIFPMGQGWSALLHLFVEISDYCT